MKRTIALLLILCFGFTLCFSGCENDESKNPSSAEKSQESQISLTSDGNNQPEEPDEKSEEEESFAAESADSIESSMTDSSENDDATLGNETSFPDESTDIENGFLNEAKYWDETVNILGYNGEHSYHSIQIDTEAMTEEPLNDAVFKRNYTIERQYGIEIKVTLPVISEDPIDILINDITSGMNEYDAIVLPLAYIAPLAVEGLLTDLNSVENDYLHLDMPWWDQGMISDLSVNNKVYFLAGDALLEDDEATWVMYFNKDMFESNAALTDTLDGSGSIYSLVKDGKWTMDKMYEMAKAVNANPEDATYADSLFKGGYQWGMVAQSYDFYQMMQGGRQLIVDNSNSKPVLRIGEQTNIDIFNKLADIFYDGKVVGVAEFHASWNSGVYDREREIFALGNALFMPGSVAAIGKAVMREADIRYGILPLPKADESQQNYASAVTVYHCSVIAVPINNYGQSLDVTCYALEAMAYYGQKLVTPEYYNRVLSLKRYEDNESAEMLDIIFRNKIYDMGAVYNFHGGDYNGTLYFYTNLLGSKSTNIASLLAKNQSSYQAGIDDFVRKCYA